MDNLHPSYFFDLSSYRHQNLFNDCDRVWQALSNIASYLKSYSLGNIEVPVPEGVYLINPEQISIGKGTVIEPGTYIKGPCVIGENCTIRHGAYIRGNLIAGDYCVIGHDTEVKNGVFLDYAQAAHFAYVGDSILGNRINIGAGTVCANLKLDKRSVAVYYEGERIDTGLRKFGAIIGDDSQTGCNSVTNPGTLLGKSVRCYPCTNFGGFVPSGQTVRPTSKTERF